MCLCLHAICVYIHVRNCAGVFVHVCVLVCDNICMYVSVIYYIFYSLNLHIVMSL